MAAMQMVRGRRRPMWPAAPARTCAISPRATAALFPREWVAEVIDGREIVAAHGERQMPVWGNAFAELDAANGSSKARTEAKIQALVAYLIEVQQTQ